MVERLARTVLVVDDDERVLASFRRGFAREWQVTTTPSASAATQLAGEHHFDLAILDLRLGDTSSVPLIRELRAKQPDLRIALMSGYLTTDSTVAAVHAGVEIVVDKPITPREILRRLDAGRAADVDANETPTLAQAVDAHIARVQADCDGNITETARRLGIHRSSLQRRLGRKLAPKK